MKITVDSAEGNRELEVQAGQTVLDVLQANGIDIQATCGGIGKCGKCQVLIKDSEGLNYKLACVTEVVDGMEVVIERREAMTVQEDGVALAFAPDEGRNGYGLAIDIGTTTVVAHLHDLSNGVRVATVSRANPQIAFGADVISRITASVDGKLDMMCECIRDALRTMKTQLCKTVGVDPESVVDVAVCGNTTMQHIFCGLAPDTIGVSPFTPLSLFGDVHEVEGIGSCYMLPCSAGYVGGDITAGMLVRGLDDGHTKLFMDLGTNGEMALSYQGHIINCATAAGPVFEGANVRFGMPAAPGAITQVAIEDGNINLTVMGGVDPIGICGTGIIDAISEMVTHGIVSSTGRFAHAEDVSDDLKPYLGEEDGQPVFYLTDDQGIYITQGDVRCMQLAKAAVCAGVLTMAQHAQVELDEVECLEIAGGFGKFLNLESAANIGLFPKELLDRASSVGNTAGEGSSAMLISQVAHEAMAKIVGMCDYIELSNSMEFNKLYVELMTFE